MKNEIKEPIIMNIIRLSCIIYTPASLLINLICYLTLNGQMLKLWANFIVLAVCFLISCVVIYKVKLKTFKIIIKNPAILFTLISFLLDTFVYMIEDGLLWNIWSLIVIFIYSIVFTLLKIYMKVTSYIISSLIYFALNVTTFAILTFNIAGYGEGNKNIIFIGIFTLIYIIYATVRFMVLRSIEKSANEEKNYTNQFN